MRAPGRRARVPLRKTLALGRRRGQGQGRPERPNPEVRPMRCPRLRSATLAILGVALMNAATPDDTAAARGAATRSVVYGRHGMVCAAQPLAVQAGIDVLKQGGSAADAAIAVNACLGLMEPTANGLGGDLFAIVWDPKAGKLAGLNACGRSPLGLRADQIPPEADGTIPLYSPYSWSVPGTADGWFELHARYGKLPMKDVLAAAIRYAEEGFPLSPVIASDWARGANRFKDKPGFAEVFMPGGRAPAEGEVFKNPALGRTLRQLAEGGRDAYYRGPIAAAIVRYSQANGGFFSAEDFAKHRSEWVDPVSTSYRGYDVWELPPPGQGIAALQRVEFAVDRGHPVPQPRGEIVRIAVAGAGHDASPSGRGLAVDVDAAVFEIEERAGRGRAAHFDERRAIQTQRT